VKQRRSVEGEFRIYVELDWGTEFHRACVLDPSGKVLRECRVDHNGQGIGIASPTSVMPVSLYVPAPARGDEARS